MPLHSGGTGIALAQDLQLSSLFQELVYPSHPQQNLSQQLSLRDTVAQLGYGPAATQGRGLHMDAGTGGEVLSRVQPKLTFSIPRSNDHVAKKKLLTNCTFILCKGLHTQMDLVSLSTASGKRLFSFLGFGWGFISDVDIDSEKYRRLGNARFTLGTLQCLAKLRVYQGRLSYLPAVPEQGTPPAPRDHVPVTNGQAGRILPPAGTEAAGALPADSLLVPLGQPVPAHWTVVPEEEFVTVYAIYQSHLGTNLLMAPAAQLHDGCIHLFYLKAGISRVALLKIFLAMARGTHLDLNCPHLCYVPVRAFRLEPRVATGIMTVDGEALACEPVQGQVHGRLCRILSGS